MPTIQLLSRPDTLLRVSLWTALAAAVTFTRADPDLWGHVQFGIDIIRERHIPDADPYSFTSDRPWVNHEWAAEVLTGFAYLVGGAPGLVLLKFAVVGGFVLLLLQMLRREGAGDARIRDYFAAAAVMLTAQQAHHVRPQIFSLLLFAVLMSCLLSVQRGDRRWLWAAPLLFAAWVNFHGGWIVGGAVLVLWTLGVAIRSGVRAALPYGGVGLIAFVATAANPYGVGMWQFLFETVGFGRADITDWQPIHALDVSVWFSWCVTVVIAAYGIWRARGTSLDPSRVLVVGILAIASFQVNRLSGFFALATLFLFGSTLASALERGDGRAARPTRAARIAATAVAIVLIIGGAAFTAVNLTCVRVDPRLTPPPGAIEFLKTQPPGRLLVWFDWGEYAIWHLAPQFKVSTDGRRETVYSAGLHDRHLQFFFGAPAGATLPDDLAADYVWVPRSLPAGQRVPAGGWREAYADGTSVIFVRGSADAVARRSDAAPATRRCFPGP